MHMSSASGYTGMEKGGDQFSGLTERHKVKTAAFVEGQGENLKRHGSHHRLLSSLFLLVSEVLLQSWFSPLVSSPELAIRLSF